MSTKTGARNPAPGRGPAAEEGEGGPKPLAATLMQELKNLQDKFKNDDDSPEKGLQCSRIFWMWSEKIFCT